VLIIKFYPLLLNSALLSHFNLTLVNTLQENVRHVEITTFEGFICNRSSHWFAIRKINGLFWNLNSTLEKPKQISHFHLAAEIESLRNGGFSVFCVTGNLPPPCTNENELPTRGDTRFWWKEDDLVKGTGSRGYSNSWENLGNGMRLDGKQASSPDVVNLEGMTEEEMIAMAVAASIEQSTEDVISQVKLGPEPDPGQENAVRIQFRFPNGRKVARRFLKTEQVEVLAAFVQEECPGKRVEIKAGFPPKSLSPMYKETLENAKVIGEQIICQFL
jgi:ataxin-3